MFSLGLYLSFRDHWVLSWEWYCWSIRCVYLQCQWTHQGPFRNAHTPSPSPSSMWESRLPRSLASTWYCPWLPLPPHEWVCGHISDDQQDRPLSVCLWNLWKRIFWFVLLRRAYSSLLSIFMLSFSCWHVGVLCIFFVHGLCQTYTLSISVFDMELYVLPFDEFFFNFYFSFFFFFCPSMQLAGS